MPWLCVTTVSLLALSSCASPSTQQPPWEGCRAASKTEYESAKRDFLLQTGVGGSDWPLVAALLLVLSFVVAHTHQGGHDWAVADHCFSLADVHFQPWMLLVTGIVLFWFIYVWATR
jgi:hypothetical protein